MEGVKQSSHPTIVLPCGAVVDHLSVDVLKMYLETYGGIPMEREECKRCPFVDWVIVDFGFSVQVCRAIEWMNYEEF
ncbi:hypothetical protein [Palaeococcus ferrophilus]|uniref:hypothetical protein n=1 Tax=Palaeococcus ferrophilus TaxID=83868 RepID=UPI00064E82BD|nr:hypothetical protein [Palaeococcus ferrophilus]